MVVWQSRHRNLGYCHPVSVAAVAAAKFVPPRDDLLQIMQLDASQVVVGVFNPSTDRIDRWEAPTELERPLSLEWAVSWLTEIRCGGDASPVWTSPDRVQTASEADSVVLNRIEPE